MAGRKVWLRTSGLTDRFVVGDVVITRDGTEVATETQAKEIEQAALTHEVLIARMEQAPDPTQLPDQPDDTIVAGGGN